MLETKRLLTRAELAAELTARGFPIAKTTLETIATRGGGPRYQKFGRSALYDLAEALDWAAGRMSPPAATATEHRQIAA